MGARSYCTFLLYFSFCNLLVNRTICADNDAIEAHREHVRRRILPSFAVCGQQRSEDRLVTLNNGSSTEIDEFPWLVHLKTAFLERKEEYFLRCIGVLISKQYILTDYWCGYEAVQAIMGQYTTGQKISCTDNSTEECTEPVREYQLYSKVRSGESPHVPLDLTLIRLNTTVKYSDFIRPICLPVNGSKREQDTLIFSGWGSSVEGPEEIRKKRLVYNVVQPEVCYNRSIGLEVLAKLANATVVCLSPPSGNTDKACSGEVGGPLMYRYKNRWFTDGTAVHVNADDDGEVCGSTYTLSGVSLTPSVMNWILDNMHD